MSQPTAAKKLTPEVEAEVFNQGVEVCLAYIDGRVSAMVGSADEDVLKILHVYRTLHEKLEKLKR